MALRQRQLREQECARINAIKIHNQWRKIMRLAKADELRQQIEILSQNHEREVDRKDALIQVWCLFCFIGQRRKGQQMHSGPVDMTHARQQCSSWADGSADAPLPTQS